MRGVGHFDVDERENSWSSETLGEGARRQLSISALVAIAILAVAAFNALKPAFAPVPMETPRAAPMVMPPGALTLNG